MARTDRDIRIAMKVVAFPKSGHSYIDQFYEPIVAAGTLVEQGFASGRWLLKALNAGDVIHLHWPSFWYGGASSRLSELLRFARFVSLLLLMRAKRARIFWTAHNLLPHDRARVFHLHVLGRYILISLAERIFVHGEEANRILTRRFPLARKKTVVIHQGHYVGYYKSDISPQEARRLLRIEQTTFVYLFIGLCKEYKNLVGLVRTFEELPGESTLLIAGKFQSDAYQKSVEDAARGVRGVRLEPRYIPDHELQNYLKAANIVVIPYRDILTSGTVMLALSFGKPVVSVRMGCLIDVVTPQTGILYDPDSPTGLFNAMLEARNRSFSANVILAHAERFDWESPARALLRAL